MSISHSCFAKLLIVSIQVTFLIAACTGNFYEKFDIVWGDGRAKILNNGELLTVSLDEISGSSFQSKSKYLYCKLDMQIKLVPKNSAGTVTAYYLKSQGSAWDEIDFEFLGNVSGQPYVLHTNVFTQGRGKREQQFYLWFDPTIDFHTYTILWNPKHIVLSVDGIPIREFKNLESHKLPYLSKQPMRLYSSLWDADNWATRGGRDKINWAYAPFKASYRNFNDRGSCTWSSAGFSSCGSGLIPRVLAPWYHQMIDGVSRGKMKWARSNYMIYDYCKDWKRFPQGRQPYECKLNNQY